jgi:hypothetical protein
MHLIAIDHARLQSVVPTCRHLGPTYFTEPNIDLGNAPFPTSHPMPSALSLPSPPAANPSGCWRPPPALQHARALRQPPLQHGDGRQPGSPSPPRRVRDCELHGWIPAAGLPSSAGQSRARFPSPPCPISMAVSPPPASSRPAAIFPTRMCAVPLQPIPLDGTSHVAA